MQNLGRYAGCIVVFWPLVFLAVAVVTLVILTLTGVL
jgi:hypothetical protein